MSLAYRRVAAAFAIALVSLLASACADPIVGAECRQGFARCDGRCVDVQSDPEHCGACGNDCGRLECSEGSCGPGLRPDADGGSSLPDGGRRPPITPGGVGSSPFLPDGGLSFPDRNVDGCGLGETFCGNSCKKLLSDPNFCGACDHGCNFGMFCVNGECIDRCTAPLMFCDGICTTLTSTPENCGVCGNVCASGICQDGVCDDVIPGQIVIFGHDYKQPGDAVATMKRLAGNALFLARGAPVRALIYRGSADSTSAEGVEAAIEFTAAQDGRPWTRTEAIVDEVPFQLYFADALIIHAQPGASDDELKKIGRDWGYALGRFLLRGGVVLLFDTPSENNSGTYKLLTPTGLFAAGSRGSIARQTLTVVNPGIGVAARTTRSYRSATNTVRFRGVTTPGNVVVQDRDGEAVVFHRVVSR